ncbi:uncharacterized protein LOC130735639 [Lotus japonicus]|uniref:uncharacterized protein LOC130735639 n=1 Tax=Lotus japonicus TaxID=34305 RepID=UPI00258D9009|nr:uncharacterized protein LOC130735639 [Lotus japonicus]
MELKMRECERETKEDCIHTILFTAGTFLLMVYLKSFLVEQWRAWVFLILNVILLAILFMSMRPVSWDRSAESESDVEEVKDDDKEKRRPCVCSSQEIEEGKECHKDVHVLQSETEEDEEEEEEEEEQVPMLSKEELNARVEAFIAMFRQHLISDVKQAEDFRLNKPANLTPKIEVPCC